MGVIVNLSHLPIFPPFPHKFLEHYFWKNRAGSPRIKDIWPRLTGHLQKRFAERRELRFIDIVTKSGRRHYESRVYSANDHLERLGWSRRFVGTACWSGGFWKFLPCLRNRLATWNAATKGIGPTNSKTSGMRRIIPFATNIRYDSQNPAASSVFLISRNRSSIAENFYKILQVAGLDKKRTCFSGGTGTSLTVSADQPKGAPALLQGCAEE